MKENALLILGAGQYGKVAREIAIDMGCFDVIDFLDDHARDVLGKISECEKFADKYKYAIVAIGNSRTRMKLLDKLQVIGYEIPSLIHSRSYVSMSARIERGCIIEPFVGVNANVKVGMGCLLSMGCVINHNVVISRGCHINCGAIVEAGVLVPTGERVSCGEVYRNK